MKSRGGGAQTCVLLYAKKGSADIGGAFFCFLKNRYSSGVSIKSVAAQRLVDSTALSQLSCEL